MQVRLLYSNAVKGRDRRARLEQLFHWQLGSWAGHLRRADLWVEERTESGPGFSCWAHSTLSDWGDLSVHAVGSDLECAVRSAARQLQQRIRAHCPPSGVSR